jgi:hypothetical protein
LLQSELKAVGNMVPDLCIDRGLSLAQWLKLIEETEAQPPCEISEAKYTFIAIHFFC